MTRAYTGTGPHRRRLTEQEALTGGGLLPDPFTPEEWAAMERASAEETTAKIRRIVGEMLAETIAQREGR
jgi:hypothetical protein